MGQLPRQCPEVIPRRHTLLHGGHHLEWLVGHHGLVLLRLRQQCPTGGVDVLITLIQGEELGERGIVVLWSGRSGLGTGSLGHGGVCRVLMWRRSPKEQIYEAAIVVQCYAPAAHLPSPAHCGLEIQGSLVHNLLCAALGRSLPLRLVLELLKHA